MKFHQSENRDEISSVYTLVLFAKAKLIFREINTIFFLLGGGGGGGILFVNAKVPVIPIHFS